MEGGGKGPENKKATNNMSTQGPRGVKRPFSSRRAQVQTATSSMQSVTFENASPGHPGHQISAVASEDDRSYIDITLREALQELKEEAAKQRGEN